MVKLTFRPLVNNGHTGSRWPPHLAPWPAACLLVAFGPESDNRVSDHSMNNASEGLTRERSVSSVLACVWLQMGGGEWQLPMHRAPAAAAASASLASLQRHPAASGAILTHSLSLSLLSMLLCVCSQFADLNAFKVPDQRDYVDRLSVNFVSVTSSYTAAAAANTQPQYNRC